MEKKNFEIVPSPIKDNDGKETMSYQVQDYDNCMNILNSYCTNILINYKTVNDIDTYKNLKEDRTELRKKLDLIKSGRINLIDSLVGTFDSQLKSFEKVLKETDLMLKEKVDDYDLKVLGKTKAPSKITIEIKSFDRKKIDRIITFASKIDGVEIKEK